MIKIDVDSRRYLPLDELVERLRAANRQLVALAQWRSPSGKGWHMVAVVSPRPRSAVETVALQLLLGSDPRREGYNLNRALAVDAGLVSPFWRRRWNVLYGRARKD